MFCHQRIFYSCLSRTGKTLGDFCLRLYIDFVVNLVKINLWVDSVLFLLTSYSSPQCLGSVRGLVFLEDRWRSRVSLYFSAWSVDLLFIFRREICALLTQLHIFPSNSGNLMLPYAFFNYLLSFL